MEKIEFCLDTNVIIEFLKDEASTSSEFIRKAVRKAKLYTTSISVYKLYFEPKYGGYEKEISDIDSLLIWIDVLSFDSSSAKIAAEIDATLNKKGKPIGLRDVFIAAISISNKVSLVTRNTKHFKTIKNETKYSLDLLTPEEALKKVK